MDDFWLKRPQKMGDVHDVPIFLKEILERQNQFRVDFWKIDLTMSFERSMFLNKNFVRNLCRNTKICKAAGGRIYIEFFMRSQSKKIRLFGLKKEFTIWQIWNN